MPRATPSLLGIPVRPWCLCIKKSGGAPYLDLPSNIWDAEDKGKLLRVPRVVLTGRPWLFCKSSPQPQLGNRSVCDSRDDSVEDETPSFR